MNHTTEIELIRLLHGELPEDRARELRARIVREPELARAWERLSRTWEGLAEPSSPPSPIPLGFAARVMARAREESSRRSGAPVPAWVRAVAAAALVAGVALGAEVGASWPEAKGGTAGTSAAAEIGLDTGFTDASGGLADDYWQAVQSLDTASPSAGDDGGAQP
jgi:anti-sigma factor RsiW